MKRLLIIAGLLFFCSPATAQQAAYVYTPLGYQQITPVPTGTFLTVPQAARVAEICISTQAIRYRDDGTAPTAAVGMPVLVGTCFQYSGNLATIQFIQQVAGAVLDVSYYR
jgi:hypothetical protein